MALFTHEFVWTESVLCGAACIQRLVVVKSLLLGSSSDIFWTTCCDYHVRKDLCRLSSLLSTKIDSCVELAVVDFAQTLLFDFRKEDVDVNQCALTIDDSGISSDLCECLAINLTRLSSVVCE